MMNNILINAMADIFFLNKRDIIISCEDNIVSISDLESGTLKKFLSSLYKNNRAKKTLPCAGNKHLSQAIDRLIELRVLLMCDCDSTQSDMLVSLQPFIPYKICGYTWCVRRGIKILYFYAENASSAMARVKDFALSWKDELESGIINAMFSQAANCLSAKHSVPTVDNIPNVGYDDVLIFDCIKRDFQHQALLSHASVQSDFWNALADKTTGDIGVVPLVHKLIGRIDQPFELENQIFLSCHRAHSLLDVDDDWQIGSDAIEKVAKGKAIMESIERFCGRSDKISSIIRCTADELGGKNYIHPRNLAAYSNLQRKKGWLNHLTEFKRNLVFEWVEMEGLFGKQSKYVPLCFASYYYSQHGKEKKRIFISSSNGMAAHTSKEESIRRGALEIIERDAIMIYWFNKIPPIKIALNSSMPGYVKRFVDKINSIGLNCTVVDLTLDTVPIVMAIASGVYKNNRTFFCGAAASENYQSAIIKSIEELEFSVWSRLSDFDDLKAKINQINVLDISTPLDHEAVYMRKDMINHLDFLLKGDEVISLADVENDNYDVFEAIRKIGSEIYHIDMTHECVKKTMLDISVSRVIIPDFIPITFGYGQEPLAMKRLLDVPFRVGLRKKSLKEADLINGYLPHFFA